MKYPLRLNVNGQVHDVEVEPDTVLLDVLRDDLLLTGTKWACRTGDCGACTVIIDVRAVVSCIVPALEADSRTLVTIEGIIREGGLSPIQEAFIERGAAQCGYCTPGVIVMAEALLEENPSPSEEDVRAGLAGNLCRCTGYNKIVDAVLAAAGSASPAGEPLS